MRKLYPKLIRLAALFMLGFLFVASSVFNSCGSSSSSVMEMTKVPIPNPLVMKKEFFAPVIKRLRIEGMDSCFIEEMMSDTRIHFDESLVRINVTGYRKAADYSHNYNAFSVKNAKEFLSVHEETFSAAEKKYSVDREVIASILWIETKNGQVLGRNHVISVFLSIALANEPYYVKKNKDNLRQNEPNLSPSALDSLDGIIEKRALKKANWSVGELKSLEKMAKKNSSVFSLYGSWAGAFGMTQFLPSSYLQWAADGNGDNLIDLFAVEDAIFSIANYLKTNGWGNSRKEQEKAVFHYNNSKDYVNAVLTLAEKLK